MIIDSLTHISTQPDDVIGWGPRFLVEDLLAQMDAPRTVFGKPARIDKAVVFPAWGLTVPTSPLSFLDQHAYVIESVAKYPDRLIGGAIIHPRLWNDAVASQLEDLVANHNFRMVYLSPGLHKFWLPIKTPSEGEGSRKLLFPIFEAARRLHLPVMLHLGDQPYALPATADYIAGAFPDVTIIIAHLGTQGSVYTLEALLVAEHHPNIYMETSFAQVHMLIETIHTIGAERVIFGSNCPPLEPTQQLMMVEEALSMEPPIGMSLPAEGVRKVMGENLQGLISATKASLQKA